MQSDPTFTEIFNGTTGNGTPFPCNVAGSVSFEFEFKAGTTAGAFNITRASSKDYAGAWDVLESRNFVVDALAAATLYVSASLPVPGFCRIEPTINMSGGATPGLIVRAKRYYN